MESHLSESEDNLFQAENKDKEGAELAATALNAAVPRPSETALGQDRF